jgi:hypothetical protein
MSYIPSFIHQHVLVLHETITARLYISSLRPAETMKNGKNGKLETVLSPLPENFCVPAAKNGPGRDVWKKMGYSEGSAPGSDGIVGVMRALFKERSS